MNLMDEKKKELLRMANYLHNLFMDNGIWYCLAFGSMLGAIRHNGFIPWDRDFDIHIKIDDRDRVRDLIISHPLPGAVLQIRGSNHCTSSHDVLMSNRIDYCVIDIHQFIGVPIEKNKRLLFSYICYFIDMTFRHKYVELKRCRPENRIKASIVKLISQIVPDILIEKIYQKLESKYELCNSKFVKPLCSPYVPHDCILNDSLEYRVMHQFEDVSFMILKDYDNYLSSMYGDYMTPKRRGKIISTTSGDCRG